MGCWLPDEFTWFRDKEVIELKLKTILKKKENSFISIIDYLCTINDNKYLYKAIYYDRDIHKKEYVTIYLNEGDHNKLQKCYWMFK